VPRAASINDHPDPSEDHAGRDDDDQEQGCPGSYEADHARCNTHDTDGILEECTRGFASPCRDHFKSAIENQVDSQDFYEDSERKRDEEAEEDGDDTTEDLLSPPESGMRGFDLNPLFCKRLLYSQSCLP
jgi:hypothetical protein